MDKKGNYVAFTASVMTSNGSSVHDTLDHGELSQDDSDDEVDLQVAYNKLLEECTKLKKLNKITFKKLNEVELEK